MKAAGEARWQDDAACRGLDVEEFYPDEGNHPTAVARTTCASCPVRLACLDHALATGEWYGYWGGLTPKERRREARRRRDASRRERRRREVAA